MSYSIPLLNPIVEGTAGMDFGDKAMLDAAGVKRIEIVELAGVNNLVLLPAHANKLLRCRGTSEAADIIYPAITLTVTTATGWPVGAQLHFFSCTPTGAGVYPNRHVKVATEEASVRVCSRYPGYLVGTRGLNALGTLTYIGYIEGVYTYIVSGDIMPWPYA